jgi:hypothetical protein
MDYGAQLHDWEPDELESMELSLCLLGARLYEASLIQSIAANHHTCQVNRNLHRAHPPPGLGDATLSVRY